MSIDQIKCECGGRKEDDGHRHGHHLHAGRHSFGLRKKKDRNPTIPQLECVSSSTFLSRPTLPKFSLLIFFF